MPLLADSPSLEIVSPRPAIPDRLEDLDIPRSLVGDLILRYLWLHGSATLGVGLAVLYGLTLLVHDLRRGGPRALAGPA